MLYFQIILSVIIVVLGFTWAIAPKYVLEKSMRKGQVEGEGIEEKDARMISRIRLVGIGQLVVGLVWLGTELLGDIQAAYYQIILSVGLILIGLLMTLLPTYAPKLDEAADKIAEKRARRTGILLLSIGAVLLVLDFIFFV